MRRRDALILGGAVATAIAIPPILRRIPSGFEFEPLQGFDGFRQLSGGAVSGGIDPFFGLDGNNGAQRAAIPRTPCLALFGPAGWSKESLPIAIFSDFNCPYCKVLETRLIKLRDGGAPIRLIWHEMPLLGPSSERYAKAVLAADILGHGERARAYLSTNPLRPGPTALRSLAQQLQIDPDALQHEVNGARVAQKLDRSLALGRSLGIPGTPGTVVGRTLVIGAINQTDLKALIKLEIDTPQNLCA